MKKYIALTILSAAALLVACNKEELQPEFGSDSIILSLTSGDMATKADDDTPVSFEDAIDHFDFFFFDDAAGTTPTAGMHGRASGSSTELATGTGETYAALRKGTHYVYILANYPSTIDHTHDWELEDILALAISSPIAEEKIKEENPETHEMEETGAVRFCSNLVMDSYAVSGGTATYTTALTPAKIREQREVTISLSRVAVKLNLTLNIESSVAGTIGDTWTPILKDLQAYYVNALNNKSTVSGAPVNRAGIPAANAGDYAYFTYPTAYAVDSVSATDGVYTYVAAPVYTYPQTWTSGDEGEPYFKVFMPWYSNKRGTSNFYYKIAVPKPASGTTWTLERNTCYNVTVDLAVVDAGNDYIEVDGSFTIQDWGTGGEPGGSGLAAAKFFDVPVREYTLYSKESLAIPYSSSSAVTAYFTEIDYWYYGSTNGTHYHFRFDPADAVSTVTLPTDKDSDNQTLNVTNYAGTSVNAAKDLNEYSLVADGKNVNFTHSLTDIFSVRTIKLVIKNQEGRTAEVTLVQHPAIEVKAHNSKNMFLDGWYYLGDENVRDADGNLTGYKHTPTGNEYMPHIPYWRTRTAWHADGSNYYGTIFANAHTSVRADHFFLTEVSVSAFTATNNKYKVRSGSNTGTLTEKAYRLGDPRVRAGVYYYVPTSSSNPKFVLPDYLYSDRAKREDQGGGSYREYNDPTDSLRAWEQPMRVLIASQNVDDQNIIAPRLLVSSHMNITSGVKWNNTDGSGVVQRCAMYQENGYPAGRWRLPTEAEVAFMMRLQSDGTLPGLFADNCNYWLADGRMIHVGTGGNIYPYVSNSSGTVYIRMVYDLWYWGENATDGVEKIRTPEMMTDWEKAMSEDGVTPNWKAHWADYYHANMHER
ncbi:MAG: hypothetical protein K6F98_04560 [Bacteroidales bacterium]|nr:hypothetical protein [Bacteroidales bacterium]